MAGNPFRRPPSNLPEDERSPARPSTPPPTKSRTVKKKVKIQTPPHSPEDPPRRASAGHISPPPPPQDDSPDEGEESDSTATADSELEEASRNTRRNSGPLIAPQPALPTPTIKAPYNPFARTLATTEAAYGLQHSDESAKKLDEEAPNAGRPAMNVEQFKNILLGQAAAPSPPAVSFSNPAQANGARDTDIAKHSFFDPQYDMDTPRASFDHMDDLESASSDDDEHSSLMSGSERLDDLAPPAPPKQSGSAAGRGPQTVSFADFDQSFSSTTSAAMTSAPPVSKGMGDKLRPPELRRQPRDLNKPLPEPPPQSPPATSTQFESADKAISTPQPSDQSSIDTEDSKRIPPPPPTARRMRAGSNPKQESSLSEGPASTPKSAETGAKPSAPPPPPPSRKSRPAPPTQNPSGDIQPMESSSSEVLPRASDTKTMPPPPPPRNSTKQPTTLVREHSDSSMSSIPRIETSSSSSTSQNQNAPPVPPPPRRAGTNPNRTSVDSRPASLKDHRRSSAQSVDTQRSNSLQNLSEIQENTGEAASPSGDVASRDILADMSAFQAEIDALRAKAGNG